MTERPKGLDDLLDFVAERVDRDGANPAWSKSTPEDIDAWLRDVMPDTNRLKFYQWVGALAVREAIGVLEDNLSNDPREPQAQHYHRDDVYEMLEIVKPAEDNAFPSKLSRGRS
jgi:uncharacterized membrane-anchored protein YjiN (DUF445 family)